MSAPVAIGSLDDLLPGDLMFAGMGSAPTKAIVYIGQLMLAEHVRLGKLAVGHVGIVTRAPRQDDVSGGMSSPGYIVEAMPRGARQRQLRASDWSPGTAFVRLPERYPGQRADAARIARRMIGTPYSFGSYAMLAAWRFGLRIDWLERRINRRHPAKLLTMASGAKREVALPLEAICSVLADQAWALTGAQVMPHGTRPQVVTPGALALHVWNRPGVVRGGAGVLY